MRCLIHCLVDAEKQCALSRTTNMAGAQYMNICLRCKRAAKRNAPLTYEPYTREITRAIELCIQRMDTQTKYSRFVPRICRTMRAKESRTESHCIGSEYLDTFYIKKVQTKVIQYRNPDKNTLKKV